MKIYRKEFYQKIPVSVATAWDFFSSPDNLAQITPTDMTFEVTSPVTTKKMYEGMIITYNVVPLLGIKLSWVTEITEIKENTYFIDEQRFGPFAFWHHEHHFEATEDGVLMHDILYYSVGWGFIGTIANNVMVNNKIDRIFNFRYEKINELFLKEG